MLAGFVDLDGLGVLEPGLFAPFVGAGVSVLHTRIGKTTMTFPATMTTVPVSSRTGLAWIVTVGVAMAVGENTMLDLAWRYTDLGRVRTDRSPGRVVWWDGNREPRPLDLAPTEARLKGQGVRLSLRYAFRSSSRSANGGGCRDAILAEPVCRLSRPSAGRAIRFGI